MTEQQNSISSAVFGLQSSLDNLKQQWTCLQNNPEESKNKPNDLHSLGKVNLDKAREEFAHHINIIRNVCTQFETEVLGDVMKMGAGADPAFRKHFTHLKEQATLESTVRRVKENLKQTKEFFDNSLREKEESKSKIETQRLEKLARSMGLVTFIDSTQKFESDVPITTITLGGTVIVVDIDIDDTGRVLRAKVTYVSETLQNDKDERVDAMLTENLQNHQFELFKRNLGSLALLDQLNVKYNPTDFFLITKNLFNDLTTICQQEVSMESNVSTILLEGHGIPTFHLGYPGIALAYWMDREHTNKTDWEEVKTVLFDQTQNHSSLSLASRLLITFEDSLQPMHYLPTQSRTSYLLGFDETEESINTEQFKVVTEATAPAYMPHLHFVKPLPGHPETTPIPIRFVMTLDPPLPVSDEICQKLLSSTGLLNVDAMSDIVHNHASTSLSLEEMLVTDINDEDSMFLLTKENWKSTFVNKDTTYEMVYNWMSSSPSSAKLVTRIPFQHPVQIFNILQGLRQQQMFNVLFKSIFNKNTYCKNEEDSKKSISLQDILLAESDNNNRTVKVKVNTVDAPNSLHLSFTTPSLPNQPSSFIIMPLSIDIPSNQPTKPTVRLHSSPDPTQHWNPRLFDVQQLTQQIQASHNLTALIQSIYELMLAEDSAYLIQSKRRLSDEDIMNNNKSMKMELD
ncbi:MAG: mediator of RNA polymerase II transcription subunit 1-domain-containing protein [Benjaminiella poitrasii]|nr:MAG: mediator of RNA polymerase II transcription subunit 1-domain-containing protein [Benjaminiella poitrasii]